MNHYIFNSTPINGEFLKTCLAIKSDKLGNLEDYKFLTKKTDEEDGFSCWSWAFSAPGEHVNLNDIAESNSEIVLAQKPLMRRLCDQAEASEIKLLSFQSVASTTVNDIKLKLVQLKQGEEPSTLEFQIALSLTLINIVNHFEEKPEELFDFPIFISYKNKHNLGADYLVEDFLETVKLSLIAGSAF